MRNYKKKRRYQSGGTPIDTLMNQQGALPLVMSNYISLLEKFPNLKQGPKDPYTSQPGAYNMTSSQYKSGQMPYSDINISRTSGIPDSISSSGTGSKSKSSEVLYEKRDGGGIDKNAPQGGGFLSNIMSSGEGSFPMNMLGSVGGIAQGIGGLTDNNRFNQGTSAGSAIGSGVDMALNAVPGVGPFLSKLGLGNKLGTWVGGKFDKKPPGSYTPSGNTTGNFRDYQTGGYLGRIYSSNPKEKKGYAEYYYDPKQAKHLDTLEKKYNIPEGTLAAVSYKETGRAKKVDGKWQYSPTPDLVSSAGAQGQFQFMPYVAKDRGIDPLDFEQASEAAAQKLRADFDRTGSWQGALASYNAGRGRYNQFVNNGRPLPKETQNYIPGVLSHRENYTGYPNSLPFNDIPTVVAPGPDFIGPVDSTGIEQTIPMMKKQMGGETGTEVEIEGDEFVYSPEGVTENSFKMMDSTGKKHISPFGFLAKGASHDNEGIKVSAEDGYIASKHLGINGKKSNKKNPSVAKLMIENGGSALAKGYKGKWDKRGINQWNPASVRHHLNLMEDIKNNAEKGKLLNGMESEVSFDQMIDTLTESEINQIYKSVSNLPEAKRGGYVTNYFKNKK